MPGIIFNAVAYIVALLETGMESMPLLHLLSTVSTKNKIQAGSALLLPLFSFPLFFIAMFFWGSPKSVDFCHFDQFINKK